MDGLPFATVIEPAIRLANEGFVIDEYRSRSIGEDSARLVLFPASRATFLPNDRPPVAGLYVQAAGAGRDPGGGS